MGGEPLEPQPVLPKPCLQVVVTLPTEIAPVYNIVKT